MYIYIYIYIYYIHAFEAHACMEALYMHMHSVYADSHSFISSPGFFLWHLTASWNSAYAYIPEQIHTYIHTCIHTYMCGI